MVKVGQKVICEPFARIKIQGMHELPTNVPGKVVYVNEKHHWFGVEYGGEDKLRTSFHFCDIGDIVRVVS